MWGFRVLYKGWCLWAHPAGEGSLSPAYPVNSQMERTDTMGQAGALHHVSAAGWGSLPSSPDGLREGLPHPLLGHHLPLTSHQWDPLATQAGRQPCTVWFQNVKHEGDRSQEKQV